MRIGPFSIIEKNVKIGDGCIIGNNVTIACDTIIGDTKVKPIANRVVIFDGTIVHNGHSPCEHNNRIIINSNYDVG